MQALPEIERKHLVVVDRDGCPDAEIRRRLQSGSDCESGFSLTGSTIPARNQTTFLVLREGKEVAFYGLLRLYNKNPAVREDPDADPAYDGVISFFFGPWADGEAGVRVTVSENQGWSIHRNLHWVETKTTAWPLLRPLAVEFRHDLQNRGCIFESEEVYFRVTFDEADIFKVSDSVDFNLGRTDCVPFEPSSWNAADVCGVLHRHATAAGGAAEPQAGEQPAPAGFPVSVTNDILMVMRNRPYTPAALDEEMGTLAGWGVQRLHWIDNTGYPALPGTAYPESLNNCGDLLKAGCSAAHKAGLEFVADIKLYDLSYFVERTAVEGRPALPVFDGSSCLTFWPTGAESDGLFIQSNPAWRHEAAVSVSGLRLYSLEEISPLDARDLVIEESDDNLAYRTVDTSALNVRVSRVERANRRWTVSGVVPDEGTHRCWELALSGIRVGAPFISIRVKKDNVSVLNLNFAAIEADNDEGDTLPHIIGNPLGGVMPFEHHTRGDRRRYSFNTGGMLSGGDEPVVNVKRWSLADFGICFREPTHIPGILEPTEPAARRIWLQRVEAALAAGADGVGIRTLRHHCGCHSWSRYAFAPVVIEKFAERFGRPPSATWDDVERIRRIRSEGYSEFIRQAAETVARAGKKLIFQLERTGGSLSAVDTRMGFAFEIERWMEEQWIDEIHVRGASGYDPWLRNVLLPQAKRHRIGVHLVTKNASTGYTHSDLLQFRKAAADARRIGYAGFNFYESVNLYEHTAAGTVQPRALARECVRDVTSATGL